jgi:hypothetical protein
MGPLSRLLPELRRFALVAAGFLTDRVTARAATGFATALTAAAFFGTDLAFFCPVLFFEPFWAGIFFFNAFFRLVVLADFTVFFDARFPGFLRADVLPGRFDADLEAAFLTTLLALPLAPLFLVAAFFAAICLASKTD